MYEEDSSGVKTIRLSLESDHQEGDEEMSSPLGLTLSKTPSFLNLLEMSLSKARKSDDLGSLEKLKASNFPALYIRIGSWQRMTRHEGDLTAKMYYAKRKLVWEVLDGALKSKIEIQWSHISAMRAITPHNLPATLEIELNQPPLFYREVNPQPRKHTLWQQASDFTGGQAPVWRRHYVSFPPGLLDRHYEKLLQCDPRLRALSEKPFPSHESPYFDPTMFAISQLSLGFNNYEWSSHEHQNVRGTSSNYEGLPHYNPQPQWTMPPHQHYSNINDDALLMEQQHFTTIYSHPPYFLPG
ncbi:uncharacterized protein LOC121790330 [Salvia splendens]|uniref:uncharacterized protein LOC121790330 n=1 Tax=Salvia splendens TaxID=180675 RepID=UPI001C27A0F4|nr:uncharacterized protein LOC121790330 [Salvia splendens]